MTPRHTLTGATAMPCVRIDALGAGRDPLGALYDPDYLDVHRDGVAQ
jgi:hypothetical protein